MYNAFRLFTALLILHVFYSGPVFAGEFKWTHDLSVEAHADLKTYRARLAARFHIGDADVELVLSNVDKHADAYMILRLHEISGVPINDVLADYRSNNGKGWGVLAKRLGIHPGSKEFHALKRGHDLSGYSHSLTSEKSQHGKAKENGKNKSKDKPH